MQIEQNTAVLRFRRHYPLGRHPASAHSLRAYIFVQRQRRHYPLVGQPVLLDGISDFRRTRPDHLQYVFELWTGHGFPLSINNSEFGHLLMALKNWAVARGFLITAEAQSSLSILS